jgi:hypothetical protein
MQVLALIPLRHSRERGNPDFPRAHLLKAWIPAFAGMTGLNFPRTGAVP